MIHFLTEHFARLWAVTVLPIVLPAVLYGWHKRQITIRHPALHVQKTMRKRWSVLLIASYIALATVVVSSTFALMAPREPAAVTNHIEQKRNVCLLGDRSGSMESVLDEGLPELADDEAQSKNDANAKTIDNGGSDKLIVSSGSNQAAPTEDLIPGQATRVDGMYLAMRFLIRHRMTDNADETDRFCIMTFDTDTYVMAPLSTDKQVLLLRSVHLKENVGGGTNFFGPTSSEPDVGPIQKAADFFAKYTSANSVNVVIIITDGYDSGDPVRIQQLLALYRQAHLRFYVIGLGDAWTQGNSLDLQNFANAIHATDPTNGIVFTAGNPGQMDDAMQTINRLEKSQELIQSVQTYQETPFWILVTAAGSSMLFVLLALLSRRIP